MNNHEIAKEILTSYGYENVAIKNAVKGRDRCVYYGPDDSVLYIHNESHNLIDKIMAAHEVSHFLNYVEGVADFQRVKKTDKSNLLVFLPLLLMTILSAVFNVLDVALGFYKWPYLIVSIFCSFFLLRYFFNELFIYENDESITQYRAVAELSKVVQNNNIELDEDLLLNTALEHLRKYLFKDNAIIKGLVIGFSLINLLSILFM